MAMNALIKEHTAHRAARAKATESKVEQVLVAADGLENDIRAAVGIQLQSVVNNQQQLEVATRKLRESIGGFTKKCTQWNQQTDALKQSVRELGSVAAYISSCDAQLQRINEHLEFAADRLSSED